MANDWWGVITVVGAWGWISAGVGFIIRSFPGRGGFNSGAAIIWGSLFVFFQILWLVGMRMC